MLIHVTPMRLRRPYHGQDRRDPVGLLPLSEVSRWVASRNPHTRIYGGICEVDNVAVMGD